MFGLLVWTPIIFKCSTTWRDVTFDQILMTRAVVIETRVYKCIIHVDNVDLYFTINMVVKIIKNFIHFSLIR